MKSLHLTNAWHSTSGGIATFYRALIEAAQERGHEICLVVPGPEDQIEHRGSHARIYSIASRPAPLNPEYRLLLPMSYLRSGTRLRQILNHEKPDLVEVCDKYTLNYFAAMLRAGIMDDVTCKPLVVGLSCERMDDNLRAYVGWNVITRTLARFYMKWFYFASFDHHIANSGYTAEELRSAAAGLSIRRGVWIRSMGVGAGHLSPDRRHARARRELLERINAHPDSVLLLYVGRLALEKNLGLLIDTLQCLRAQGGKDWRLILVGDGSQRERFLTQAARRTPGRVTWVGHVRDRNELAKIYANCDIFVHPNPREPFGIAVLEAMASGLPVVVPDRGGVLSYADSTNAWMAAPNGQSFANAVREAVVNQAVREQRIVRALQKAAQFSWQRAADSFLDLYEGLFRSHQGDALPAADFYSTAPSVKPVVAQFTSGFMQKLFASRWLGV